MPSSHLPIVKKSEVLHGASWKDFLHLRLVDKELREWIDQQVVTPRTREHLAFWLTHCRSIQRLSPREVLQVAASFEEHSTSDMLWRVIAEQRGLPLEPADDFISVMAMVGARAGMEKAPDYLAAVERLATAAGEKAATFQAEYHKRLHLLSARALQTPAPKPASKGLKFWSKKSESEPLKPTGKGLKLVEEIKNRQSNILISDCVSSRQDPHLGASSPHDIVKALKPGTDAIPPYTHFRPRVLDWLATLATGFYGEQLLVRLNKALKKQKRQVLIRPRPSIRDQEKYKPYHLLNIGNYNPGVAESLAASGLDRTASFLWHDSRAQLATKAPEIKKSKALQATKDSQKGTPGKGAHVLLELEPYLDDSTKLPVTMAPWAPPGTKPQECCARGLSPQTEAYYAATPAFIVLGHELIHALHDVEGISTGLYAPHDPAFSNLEEERTIQGDASKMKWDESPLTENLLRMDHGYAPRVSHDGRTPFMDLAGQYSATFGRLDTERRQRIQDAVRIFQDALRILKENPGDEEVAEKQDNIVKAAVASLQHPNEFDEFLLVTGREASDFEDVPERLRA